MNLIVDLVFKKQVARRNEQTLFMRRRATQTTQPATWKPISHAYAHRLIFSGFAASEN